MIKKHTLDFYDAYEVEKEIGIDWDNCSFATYIDNDDTYYTFYCRDVDIKACEENNKYFAKVDTAYSKGYANTVKWMEYFRSLGYNESVVLHVYW